MGIKNALKRIHMLIHSREPDELLPCLKDRPDHNHASVEDWKDFIGKAANEGIQPGLTEKEADLVRGIIEVAAIELAEMMDTQENNVRRRETMFRNAMLRDAIEEHAKEHPYEQ